MGQSRYTPNARKYFKSNFVELLDKITPEIYQIEDLNISGLELNPVSEVINTHLAAANKISTVLSISAVTNSQTSTLNSISGISQYFVKQNELTRITPSLFESNILLPLKTKFSNYNTSGDFRTYLSGTLLPMIQLVRDKGTLPTDYGNINGPLVQNMGTLSALVGNTNPANVHNYLVDKLGWFYFLNTSADGGLAWDPSGYVLSSFDKVYTGQSLKTVDGIKGFEEFIWRNYETCTTFSNLGLIPPDFVSGAADAILDPIAGIPATYTSGTQKLDSLLTLLDVVYSPLYIDQEDYTVKDTFDSYIDASITLTDQIPKGPFRKFLTSMGYSFADIADQVENIGLIYDIENVKEEYLQYVAELVGWRLIGSSPSKWRNQLRHVVSLYKKSGTIEAIQSAINNLIVNSLLDVSGAVSELWESYLPQLIWYSLATESPYFQNLNTWTYDMAQKGGVGVYNTSSLEENLKLATDSILLDLYRVYPRNFGFNDTIFDPFRLLFLDKNGKLGDIYTVIVDDQMLPFHIHKKTDPNYDYIKQGAVARGEKLAWDAAYSKGPLGEGVYMSGLSHPKEYESPTYLSSTGSINFTFNYRNRFNYPIPPFEEIKYYKDCSITGGLLDLLGERLECFGVKTSFVSSVKDYIASSTFNSTKNIESLNGFLMLFSSTQNPPNYNDVILNGSNYQKNVLGLWNGKSSHLFVDFDTNTFDFSKTTMEGDSRYAPIEASRIARMFSPAHAITKVNLNTATTDFYDAAGTTWNYIGLDKDDTRAGYTGASVLGNFEFSGAAMGAVAPGTTGGRGGLNTFKRGDVDRITDALESTTTANITSPRRALRRRNFRYTLPKEGYYDRTGFNGPTNWDLEAQNPNLLAYTADIGGSPNIDGDPTDIAGNFWFGNQGTLSSTTDAGANPFGGVSSTDLSGPGTASTTVDLYARGNLDRRTYREAYYSIISCYVKKPSTTPLTQFRLAVVDLAAPDTYYNNEVFFSWDDTAPTVETEYSPVVTGRVESVGSSWYRLSCTVRGLGRDTSKTLEGDRIFPRFSVTQADTTARHVYLSAPQFEQKLISKGDLLPSPYQPVSGESPTNNNDRGELTLGYVPSAGEFYPILDPTNPSGVWHRCEDIASTKTFSGIATSSTFPYRGLTVLGSNSKMSEITSITDRYIDRGQTPPIYITMHKLFEAKARDYAVQQTYPVVDGYWKNEIQSYANSSIANGYILNSYDDYLNFSFGIGLQKTHRDYCKYFAKHPLGLNELYNTGGNIFAQVFGKGIYNCDFDLAGSAATKPLLGNYISPSATGALPISSPAVFSTYLADSTGNNLLDSTYMASGNDSAWSWSTGGSGLPNTHVAPDGSKTGSTLVAIKDYPTATQNLWQDTETFPLSPIGTPLTISFFFKNQPELIGTNGSGLTFAGYLDAAGKTDWPETVSIGIYMGDPSPTIWYLSSSRTEGRVPYKKESTILEDAGNDWWRVSFPMRNWSGKNARARMRIYPGVQSLMTGDCSAVVWGAQIASGTAQTPFNGLGTYTATGLEEAIVPLTGTFTPPFDMASGSYTVANAFNAEFRNPHILSGVEFVQTSGAPTANEFKVFRLNNSLAKKDSENYLINNSVIKCKSFGGLPRLRFDLSSYGDRPNHFIKNHDFKLKVNALVAEDDSQILGGGQLGVWIHTKPISRRNPNLLSYTPDPLALGGNYWSTTNLGTVSSVEVTNPFGGASSLIMSGAEDANNNYALFTAQNPGGPLMPVWHSEKTLEASWYVKKPDSNAASGFMVDLVNMEAAATHDDHTVQWYWDGTTPAFISKPFTNVSHREESVGDDWWRISIAISGLADSSEQSNGDRVKLHFMLGNTQNQSETTYIRDKLMYMWAPQLEQYPIGMKDSNYLPYSLQSFPATYQAVSGAEPVYGNEVSGFMWSWAPEGKWVMHREDELSINSVLDLSHKYTFNTKQPPPDQITKCIQWQQQISELTPDVNLQTIEKTWLETFEVDFDTRNETIHNNYEYLDVIPVPSEFTEIQPFVNMDTTPYYVEVFFMPNNSPGKYLLIDSIELQDTTQRDNAAIGLGHGVETSGTPLRPFVQEDKLYLDKEQLRDVLGFYNGLMGSGTGLYATNLASRDAMITSGTLELSGGSRLNYRLSPTWGATNANNTQPNYNSFSSLEIDN